MQPAKEPTDTEIDSLLSQAGLAQPASRIEKVAAESEKGAPARFPVMDATAATATSNDIALLDGVNVRVQVLLGRARLTVEEILRLGNGSVVELEKLAGEPLDILVNDKLVAQGEVLVLNENFCIRVTNIIPPEDRA